MNLKLGSTRIDFAKMLRDLVELEYDAVAAYKTAIERLSKAEYRNQLATFQQQHECHIGELNGLLAARNEKSGKGPSAKQWVNKGEVLLGQTLKQDSGILTAMSYVEAETNNAYEAINQYKIWEEAIDVLQRGWHDEQEHKKWLEITLGSMRLEA